VYLVSRVDIFALSNNTGTVRLGGDTVCCKSDHECGVPLEATDAYILHNTDLHEVWIDAETTDDGVTWTAVVNG